MSAHGGGFCALVLKVSHPPNTLDAMEQKPSPSDELLAQRAIDRRRLRAIPDMFIQANQSSANEDFAPTRHTRQIPDSRHLEMRLRAIANKFGDICDSAELLAADNDQKALGAYVRARQSESTPALNKIVGDLHAPSPEFDWKKRTADVNVYVAALILADELAQDSYVDPRWVQPEPVELPKTATPGIMSDIAKKEW